MPHSRFGFSDAKSFVARGYDRIATDYHAARQISVPDYLNQLSDRLPDGAVVLDIGCGGGQPIAKALSERFSVTGVDISQEQIRLAAKAVPSGLFIHGDIAAMDFPCGSFDAAVMLYTLFHLPRDEHPLVLQRIRDWLKTDGLFLLSLAHDSSEGYCEDDFFGTSMYWSHFSKEESIEILTEAGFELLWESSINHGYDDKADQPSESHPIVLLRAI